MRTGRTQSQRHDHARVRAAAGGWTLASVLKRPAIPPMGRQVAPGEADCALPSAQGL